MTWTTVSTSTANGWTKSPGTGEATVPSGLPYDSFSSVLTSTLSAGAQETLVYPTNRTSADYFPGGHLLTLGGTTYASDEGYFSLSFAEGSIILTWLSGTLPAGVATVRAARRRWTNLDSLQYEDAIQELSEGAYTGLTEAVQDALDLKADLATVEGKAEASVTITGSGLVTGGGVIGADQILTVTAAGSGVAIAGTSNTTVITPADLTSWWEARTTPLGRALLDDPLTSDAQLTLGLGSAAVYPIGTSGTVVPLLSQANSFTVGQTLKNTTEPATPTLGATLYAEAGTLKMKKSDGTVVALGGGGTGGLTAHADLTGLSDVAAHPQYALLAGANFTGNITIVRSTPRLILDESDADANEQLWDLVAEAEQLSIRAVNDAEDTFGVAFKATRSGASIATVEIGGSTVAIPGAITTQAPLSITGSTARVALANVVAPATPGSGLALYAEGGKLKYKNSDGTVYVLDNSVSGSSGLTSNEIKDLIGTNAGTATGYLRNGTDIQLTYDPSGRFVTITSTAAAATSLPASSITGFATAARAAVFSSTYITEGNGIDLTFGTDAMSITVDTTELTSDIRTALTGGTAFLTAGSGITVTPTGSGATQGYQITCTVTPGSSGNFPLAFPSIYDYGADVNSGTYAGADYDLYLDLEQRITANVANPLTGNANAGTVFFGPDRSWTYGGKNVERSWGFVAATRGATPAHPTAYFRRDYASTFGYGTMPGLPANPATDPGTGYLVPATLLVDTTVRSNAGSSVYGFCSTLYIDGAQAYGEHIGGYFMGSTETPHPTLPSKSHGIVAEVEAFSTTIYVPQVAGEFDVEWRTDHNSNNDVINYQDANTFVRERRWSHAITCAAFGGVTHTAAVAIFNPIYRPVTTSNTDTGDFWHGILAREFSIDPEGYFLRTLSNHGYGLRLESSTVTYHAGVSVDSQPNSSAVPAFRAGANYGQKRAFQMETGAAIVFTGTGNLVDTSGAGSPTASTNPMVTGAATGSTYRQTDGTAGSTFYVKRDSAWHAVD